MLFFFSCLVLYSTRNTNQVSININSAKNIFSNKQILAFCKFLLEIYAQTQFITKAYLKKEF